jgi:hypothetical protein
MNSRGEKVTVPGVATSVQRIYLDNKTLTHIMDSTSPDSESWKYRNEFDTANKWRYRCCFERRGY